MASHKLTVNRPMYFVTFQDKNDASWFTETYTTRKQLDKTLASHSANFAYDVTCYEFNGQDYIKI